MNTPNIINSNLQVTQEAIIEQMKSKIFNPLLFDWKIQPEEIERKIKRFKASYALVEEKFSHRIRDNWEDSFEHQKEVVFLMLNLSKNPTFEKVMILLDHDTIEDTNITTQGLRDIHDDDNIVFPVALMTKKPFYDYINDIKDLAIFDDIKKSWILNSKMTLNDKFNYKDRYANHKLSKQERNAYENYELLRKKYKSIRNNDYSSKMISEEAVLNQAIHINYSEWFFLNDNDLWKKCLDTIECKLFDRLHWIMTLWNCSLEKIKRKIEETNTYFKDIAIKFFPGIWKLIEKKLYEMNELAIQREKKWAKSLVWNILNHNPQMKLNLK